MKMIWYSEPSLGIGEAVFNGKESAEHGYDVLRRAKVGTSKTTFEVKPPEKFRKDDPEDSWRIKLYKIPRGYDG